MIDKLIGSYMVRTGKLTEEQFEMLLEKQNTTRLKLGFIAVSKGLMTTEQANEVNLLQAKMDKRFGDLAVEKGYLTDEQVGQLLAKQGNPFLTFSQNLSEEGLANVEELDEIVAGFCRENGISEEQFAEIKDGDVDKIVPLFLPPEAQKYTHIVGTVIRTVIRLIDRHAYLDRAEMVTEFPEQDQVNQGLVWDGGMIDAFSEENGGLLKLCSIFAHEEFAAIDEDSLDAAGELLNCANGLYVSALSRQGEFMEILPPNYGKSEEEIVEGSICRVPLNLCGKKLTYTVAEIK